MIETICIFYNFLCRKQDIFPQALNNYITLNGGGFGWGSSLSKSHSMDDLIEAVICFKFTYFMSKIQLNPKFVLLFQFDITKVNKNPSRLQHADLEDCNKLEIQRHIDDPILLDQLVEKARQLIENSFPEKYIQIHS